MQNDPRRVAFLALFDPAIRSHVVNLFVERIRAGAPQNASAICRAVMEAIRAHRIEAARWPNPYPSPGREALWAAMPLHRQAAIDFADWCIEWESLTTSEKQQARGGGDGGTDVTPKRADMLRREGIAIPATRREASEIIGRIIAGRRK